MQNLWSDNMITKLSLGLDTSALRQRVVANNLANVNTPYFKRSFVEFEETLKNAGLSRLATSSPSHIASTSPIPGNDTRVVTDNSTTMRNDGNNVDVDKEMSELATNQLYYHALSQQLGERLSVLRYVINEGRR